MNEVRSLKWYQMKIVAVPDRQAERYYGKRGYRKVPARLLIKRCGDSSPVV